MLIAFEELRWLDPCTGRQLFGGAASLSPLGYMWRLLYDWENKLLPMIVSDLTIFDEVVCFGINTASHEDLGLDKHGWPSL